MGHFKANTRTRARCAGDAQRSGAGVNCVRSSAGLRARPPGRELTARGLDSARRELTTGLVEPQ